MEIMRVTIFGLLALLAISACVPAGPASAQSAASDWMKGNSSRIRLIAGRAKTGKILAGVQIELDEGWKTYWRNPGEAGGVPPELDWKTSTNVSGTETLYPAPMRLSDANGDNIGYKHGVIFPVRIEVADAAKPIGLDLKILFGVCKNICIPEERHLTLTLDTSTGADAEIDGLLTSALSSVPVAAAEFPDAPQIDGLTLNAVKRILLIDARVAGSLDRADLFVESPDGLYVPMTEKQAPGPDGGARFAIDLSKTDDFKVPSGKSLRFTLVGEAGASEVVREVP
jgi:DsbC/DsbD-like thiol-disulfide interchange protein